MSDRTLSVSHYVLSSGAAAAADAYNAQQTQPDAANWEGELMAAMKAALRNDGKVSKS